MEEPLGILKRLCSHVTGITDENKLSEQYRISVGVLRCSIWSGASGSDDAQLVGDRINKWLIRQDKLHQAVQFSNLLNNLMNSVVLKNKGSILTLLLLLGQESTHQQPAPLLPQVNGLEGIGGIRAGDAFALPSLQLGSGSLGHRTAPHREFSAWGNDSNSGDNSSRGGSFPPSDPFRDTAPTTARLSRISSMYRDKPGISSDRQQHYLSSPLRSAASSAFPNKTNNRQSQPQVEVTEEVLVREVLFILQGIEGKIIKIDQSSDGYKIDPTVRIAKPQRDLILKLAEVGWLYSQLIKFCQVEQNGKGMSKSMSVGNISSLGTQNKLSQSASHSALNHISSSGGFIAGTPVSPSSLQSISAGPTLVNQALVLALKDHLNEHCRLIAVLEAQLSCSVQINNSDPDSSGGLTLRRLLLWTLEPRLRLRCLLHMVDCARGLRGGALLSALHQHMQHGSPSNISVVQHTLSRAAAPLHAMLTQWLLHGTFTDPHQEFFIAADPKVSDHDLWHHKYSIRWNMVPSFISKDQAQKILATGKSLNFLRCACRINAPMNDHEAIAAALKDTIVESLFLPSLRPALESLITAAYRGASGRVLEEVLERQQLLQHLRALRRYLLLGQGEFIHTLMQVLRDELCKPASRLYPHNLSSLLETAVSASNARYDLPDTLRRLDVKLLQIAQGDTGWDVFSLDYHVDGPIGTVLTTDCMRQYLMLFNSLWRAKRMECLLSDTWKQQAATTKLCRQLPEVNGVIHGVQLLLSEMIHLVHQLGYYMTFEVLEVSWHALMTAVREAHSLDQVIQAHNTFLARIVKGALLDKKSMDVRNHLRSVYDLMVGLEELQKRLNSAVTAELDARQLKAQREHARTAAGEFATTAQEEEDDSQRRHNFSSRFVPKMKAELKILTQTYQDMVQSLLLMLAAHDDDNLHQLSSRLDFNEHYQRRNKSLTQRLTFHHKRKSMGGPKAAIPLHDEPIMC